MSSQTRKPCYCFLSGQATHSERCNDLNNSSTPSKAYTHALSEGELECGGCGGFGRLESPSHQCPECSGTGIVECPHSDYDHGICIDCGRDCTNELAGRAEDAWEGER